MNQDFTVKKKKSNICLKKKIPARAVSEKKQFVQAENPPPHHFSNDPSLKSFFTSFSESSLDETN